MIKIGVIGYGVVGRAVADGFHLKGHAIYVNDVNGLKESDDFKKTNMFFVSKAEMAHTCDVIFICVATPRREDGGCDLSQVYTVHGEIANEISQGIMAGLVEAPIVAIKSTVSPGTCAALIHGYRYTCSNPEFLRARHADEDFLKPDRTVIGSVDPYVISQMKLLYEGFPGSLEVVSPTEAELSKYLSNAYLVAKVAYSNLINKVAVAHGCDAEAIARCVSSDKRVNPSHMNPLGGRIDPNSPCLPKDLDALIQHLTLKGVSTDYLKMVRRMAVKPDFVKASKRFDIPCDVLEDIWEELQ